MYIYVYTSTYRDIGTKCVSEVTSSNVGGELRIEKGGAKWAIREIQHTLSEIFQYSVDILHVFFEKTHVVCQPNPFIKYLSAHP